MEKQARVAEAKWSSLSRWTELPVAQVSRFVSGSGRDRQHVATTACPCGHSCAFGNAPLAAGGPDFVFTPRHQQRQADGGRANDENSCRKQGACSGRSSPDPAYLGSLHLCRDRLLGVAWIAHRRDVVGPGPSPLWDLVPARRGVVHAIERHRRLLDLPRENGELFRQG